MANTTAHPHVRSAEGMAAAVIAFGAANPSSIATGQYVLQTSLGSPDEGEAATAAHARSWRVAFLRGL